MEALVYSNHPRKAAASVESGHIIQVECQWNTLIRLFENCANAALVSVLMLSAVQALMLAMVALKQPTKEC